MILLPRPLQPLRHLCRLQDLEVVRGEEESSRPIDLAAFRCIGFQEKEEEEAAAAGFSTRRRLPQRRPALRQASPLL